MQNTTTQNISYPSKSDENEVIPPKAPQPFPVPIPMLFTLFPFACLSCLCLVK